MIASMLSLGSLAAFSIPVSQIGPGLPGPVQPVRAVGSQPREPAPATAPMALVPPGGLTPGRILPRGSLLDLSV